MYRILFRIILSVVLLLFIITGCKAPEPFEYHPENETKSGPGLFSGEDGSFNIYSKPDDGDRAGEPEYKP